MSDKIRWPWSDGEWVANVMLAELRPFVERIEIVGSVRRRKPSVGDVELLFIPKTDTRQVDMFSTEPVDLAHEHLQRLLADGILQKRQSITGHDAGWGPKNKLAVFTEKGMPLDLFSTTAENWWCSIVCRTGGKENNLLLTNGANKLNRTWNVYGNGVTDRKTGIVTPATSERHVFELCGVPYIEPVDRK